MSLTIPACLIYPPQGRLSLTSGTPVLSASVSGAATLYYTPYLGNIVPIYDGSAYLIPTSVPEITNVLANAGTGNAGPAAVAASSCYDLFVWSNGGTPTLTRGPAWTNQTTRSAGTALARVNGILTNAVSITNGPGVNLGTYVGTIATNAAGTVDWILGGAAAGGTAASLNVWNMYNRVTVSGIVQDTTGSWAYSTAAWRSADNSNTNRVTFVQGLQEDSFDVIYQTTAYNSSATPQNIFVGITLDGTGAPSGTFVNGYLFYGIQNLSNYLVSEATTQSLGLHFYQAVENGGGTATTSFYGAPAFGLKFRGKF